MSIFFWEPRKKWVVQWTESGKKVRRYFGTEQEAKVFEEDRTDTQGGLPQSLTLGELTLYYFRANTHKHERFKSMMASLLAGREEDGKHIDGAGEFLYDIHAEKLTRKDLERMRENMRVRGLKNNSINKYQAYIRAILAWGVDQDLIQFNPWRDYKRLPVQRHIVTTNINDIRVVYAHAPEWLQWAMKTMYCLSLRSGQVELFSLLWTAFDFRRGTVTVRQGKSGHIKRVYPPSAYLTEAAQRCAEDLKFGIPLVCHRQGKRVINYSKAWEKTVREAGLPHFPMYHIRHAAATEMLTAGADPASVAAQLGHSTVTTTCNTYAHVSPGGQQKAAALMPALQKDD